MRKGSSTRTWVAGGLSWLLGALVLLSCTGLPPAPTRPPAPTMDLVGTVTAQAAPLAATQTAISAAATAVAGAQATLTAQAQAHAAVTTGTAQVEALQGTQVALAAAIGAQATIAANLAGTATAQRAVAGTLEAQATTLAGPSGTPASPTGPARTPTRTRTPTPTAPPGCQAVDAALATIATRAAEAGLNVDCPTARASAINGAVQEFWANATSADPATRLRSLMVWREDTQEIYVIRGEDVDASRARLLVYPDVFQEGDPEIQPACAALKPPTGYLMPIRGFGRVWCEDRLAPVVGWPNSKEAQADLRIQPTRHGALLRVSAPDVGINYLVAVDFDAARAVTSRAAP